MKKRGQPARIKLNPEITPEQIIGELEEFSEDDPMRELIGDGRGIDYRLPPLPWDEMTQERIRDNLATLRVDPNHSNMAQTEISIVRAIAGNDQTYEADSISMGSLFFNILADCNSETAEEKFSEITRMKRQRERPPHRNYLAYRAYCEFVASHGFEPTRRKLAKFILEQPDKYPVGLSKPTNGKPWWDMFFDAGLSRLEE
jgi:hypothetical protein